MSDTISTKNNIQVGSFRAIGAKFKLPLIVFALTTVIAGTFSVLPFFLMGQRPASSKSHMMLLETHDLGMHVPQAMDLDKSVRASGLYPRWLSNINHGYGVGTMIFYPPIFFHLLVLFNALVGGWAAAVFVVTLLSFISSALTFYLLARQSYGKFASAVGAFFYMLFPYHLLDFYWRGAVPEVMGFALLPVVIYFALKLEDGWRLRHLAGLGLFYGTYLLTHMPVGYLLTYTLAFYAVVRAIKKQDIRIAVRIAAGMAIGLMLSAIYWLPAAIETKQVYEWGTELLPYHRTYITLMEPTNLFEQIIHISFTILAVVTILAIVIPRLMGASKHSDTRGAGLHLAAQTQMWLVMAIFALFMSCSFSRYISMLIPKIQISTPAWRWLVIATMFAALLLTATIDRLMSDEGVSRAKALAFDAAIGIIVIGSIWYGAQYSIVAALANPSFEPKPDYVDSSFTPKNATRPQDLPDTPRVMIIPDNGVIGNVIWEPEYRQIELKVDTPSEVRLKTYNYPGWTARLDGQKVPMLSDKDGIQLVSVPPGLHKIETTFESTPPRTVGATISAVAFLLIVALTFADTLKLRGRRPLRSDERTAAASEYGEEARPVVQAKSKGLALLRKKSVAGAIGILIIAAIAVAIAVSRSNRKSNSGTGTPATGAGARSGSLVSGSEVRLYVEGLDAIPFATDEKALDELMGALAARDANKVDALRDLGRIINITRNTKVQVVEPGSGRVKVRVAEGEHLGKEGWVPERWVR